MLATVNQIRKMKTGGPDHQRAGQGEGLLRGQLPVQAADRRRASPRRWSSAEQHGLHAAYVRELPVRLAAVDQPKAKTVAGELLHPDTLLVVIVGKASAIEPQIADKGIAYERISFKAPISSAARAAAKAKAPAAGAGAGAGAAAK